MKKRTVSNAELAKQWRVSTSTIKRWKRQKAPLNDPAAMSTWLAGRKHLPEGIAASLGTAAVGPVSDDQGAEAAFRRLAREEAEASSEYQAAKLSGNALLAKAKQAAWLRVAEALRKASLALEEHQREQGELIRRETVEGMLRSIAYRMNLGNREASLKFQPAAEAQRIFTLLSQNYLVSIAAGASLPNAVPPWAIAALTNVTPFREPANIVAQIQEYFTDDEH